MENNLVIPEGVNKGVNIANKLNSETVLPEGFEIEENATSMVNSLNDIPNNGLPEGFEVEHISGEIRKAPNAIENFVNTLKWVNNTRKAAYQEGKDMVRIADLETKDATLGLNYVEQAELNHLTNSGKTYEDYGLHPKEDYKNEKWTLKGLAERAPRFAKTSYIEALKMLPIIAETLKSAGEGGTIGAGGGAVVGLAGGPFSEITVPTGAGVGWLWGTRVGACTRVAEIEGGLARNELRKINNEILAEGGTPLSPLEINALASSVGMVNAGLEVVGLNSILKTIPGGKLILEKMGQKSVRELAKDKAFRAKLAEVTKDYAVAQITEPTTEMVQEVSNIVAEEFARKLGGIENTPMEQNVARVIETGKSTFGATLFLGGASSAAKVSTIMVQNGMEKAQADKIAETMSPEEQADFISENIETLVSTAPSQAAEIENKISENDKEEIENDFFRKAVNTGVDESQAFALSRMLGTFAQKYAPSVEKVKEWSDKIQMRYNVPAEKTFSQQAELIDAESPHPIYPLYGRISNDIENDSFTTGGRIAEIEKEIQELSANEDNIDFNRLESLEKEWEELKKNENENTRFQSVENAGAEENEITIAKKEWEEKGTESPYFKKWFGDSKVVDKNGKPLVVYHGTSEFFSEFNSNLTNYGEVSRDFNFFTNKEKAYTNSAQDYADYWSKRNNKEGWVHEVYLSIKKPLHIKYTNTQDSNYYSPIEYYDNNFEDIKNEYNSNDYDGIIIENTDKNSDDSILYAVSNSEQIKSIGNRGTFDESNPNIYFQSMISPKTSQKAREVLAALQKIADGSDEETVKNLRDDLEQYGGTNDVTFIFGNDKKGIKHIAQRHGKKTLLKVFDTVIDGEIKRYTANKKTVILSKGNYEAVLSLDENGNKKTWLLSGWDITQKKEKSSDVNGEVSTQSATTQIKPTFSRQDLGAELSNIINDYSENLNPNVNNHEGKTYFQSAYHGTPHKFDEFSLEHIGSGEGAQAHGWGLYFAENKEVSESYKRNLEKIKIEYDGKILDEIISKYYSGRTRYNALKLAEDTFSIDLIEDDYKSDIEALKYEKNLYNTEFRKSENKRLYSLHENATDAELKEIGEDRISIAEKLDLIGDIIRHISDKEYNVKILNDRIVALEKDLHFLKTFDKTKFKRIGEGQLFEVDIPEDDVLLDECKPFSKQSAKVQKALRELAEEYEGLNDEFEYDQNGEAIYSYLAYHAGSPQDASMELNDVGIKGITYNGHADGRCYVIFDDKAINVLKTYYQEINNINNEDNNVFGPQSYEDLVEKHNDKLIEQQQKYLGYFQEGGKQNLITIMENANASTLPHEMGHLFLSALNEFAIDDEDARIQLKEVDKRLGRIAGEDYTAEQHEKFARWFEAYLYTGKAPSYTLRDVFENFKEWLRSIRDYWAANYEMPKDVQKLFDNMFGEQKSIYDKEQEQKIKNTLQKVKNLTLSKRLNDTQKRHKEIAYDIVARATGKKKEYLKRILESESSKKGMLKQKSDIINLVAEAEDNIIGSDGFLPEWLEFFSDTELYQEGNDSKLAQAALDTILNKSYKTEVDEYAFLNEADAQYNYIINQFKKEQNRDVIYSVFWEWLDGQDNFVKEIYSEQFEEDMTQIEHKEHSLEFEKIKQKILIEARKVTEKDDIEKYKKIVLTTMKELKFLTPEDKSRMATEIFDCPTVSFLEGRIDKILDMAATLNERDYRRRLFRKIDRLLEGTKNIKQGNKTVGKYDYASNKIFETLREINKLNGKQAEKYITDMKTLVDAETADDGSGISYEMKLCNMLAQIKAAGMKRPYKNTQLVKQFVDELTKMKILARDSKDELEFLAKLDNQRDISELKSILSKMPNTKIEKNLIDSIDGKTPFLRTVKDVLKSQDKASLKAKQLYIYTISNWESTLNTIFGKTIRNKYSLLQAQAEAEVWKDSMKHKFMEGAAKIYGCKIQDFDNQILKNLSEQYDFTESIYTKQPDGKYRSEFVNKRLNKMDILLAWMWYKNDVLKERLERQFGEEQLNDIMFTYLSDKDKQLGDFMMGLINEVYAPANEMYIKKYGIELPKVASYFPSSVERGSEIDLLSDYTMKSNAPSAIKTRSEATTLRMKFSNPVAIFYNHIDSMGDFIHMTEKVDKINKVFRNPVVVSLIKNKFGDAAFKELNQEILNFSYKKQSDTANWIDKVTSKVVNNWISGTLSLKASVGFKQLLSASNYAVDMPINIWMAGFADAITHPKETIDYMMKIPYLKTRFEGSAQNESLQQFVNSARLAKIKKFKELLMLNVRCGDIGAIIFGGKPYIDYMIEKKGMTEEEAINAFVDQTNRTQQSSLTSSLSNFQMASRGRGMAQLFTAYRNTQNQYIRLVADEIIDYYNAKNNGDFVSPELEKEAKTKLTKVVFNYMFLQPLFYTLATSLSVVRLANSGGEDDDWLKDVVTSLFDLNAKAIALFGDLYNYVMNVALKGEKGRAASMPILGDIEADINKLAKEDATIEDALGLLCVLVHAGTGVDLKTPLNEIQGVGDIFNGDFQRGIYRIMGYSKYRADYAILNE